MRETKTKKWSVALIRQLLEEYLEGSTPLFDLYMQVLAKEWDEVGEEVLALKRVFADWTNGLYDERELDKRLGLIHTTHFGKGEPRNG